MSGYIEDLGQLPLDSDSNIQNNTQSNNNNNNLDAEDDGSVPDGMAVRHADDEGTGEGGAADNSEDEEQELRGGNDDYSERLTSQGRKDGEGQSQQKAQAAGNDNEEEGNDDDEEEEEDDDEDDEDDEEDDEEGEQENDRPRKKKRRFRGNKYVDIEVEVDEDEEDEDEEAGEAGFEAADNYLDSSNPNAAGRRVIPIADSFADDDEEGIAADDRDHRQLERRVRDKEEAEALRIAREYKDRHRQRRQGMGASMQDFAPRSVLMPGVNDPSIWCVKCKIGRERELVMSISRKAIMAGLSITSAFQRDSFHGHLYIEARSEAHVREAVAGLIGVYITTAPILVPIEEMPDLLKSRKKETPLAAGGWVRIKRGTYKGDLAQIDDVPEGTEMITLKVVPRIDMHPKESGQSSLGDEVGVGGKKRRRPVENSLFRAAPKLFNADEVRTAYQGRSKVMKDSEGWHFQNDIYVSGYLIKDFRISAIERENINPTIDEITRFMGETAVASSAGNGDALGSAIGPDGEPLPNAGGMNSRLDLNLIADAAKQQTILQPGDYIEIFQGSQKGVIGTIDSISGNILIISPDQPADLIGSKIEVLADQVRKSFKPGDHIKVLRGKNVNESGLVLKVKDDLVTFLSDLSVQEVTVFSKDIREAAEVGTGASSVGQYELHDLVAIDNANVGVIFKIEPDTFRILDQMGSIRMIRPSQIKQKIDTRRSVALDREGYELRSGEMVKEFAQGARDTRQGRVLHVYRSLTAFLHNRDIVENGGVFVAQARNLTSIAPRSSNGPADLSKMNPAMALPPITGTPLTSGAGGRGGREVALGRHVTVFQGNHKGYKGIIKDLNGPLARVELHTRSQTITIERTKLATHDDFGGGKEPISLAKWEAQKLAPKEGRDSSRFGNNSNTTPLSARGSQGWQTSYGGGAGGQTPFRNAYASGKTPLHRGGATPAGGAFGGATPYGGASSSFAAGSATPYTSGRTPAYGGSEAFSASSRTPYVGGAGGAFNPSGSTPYGGQAGQSGNSWGGATPSYGGRPGAVAAANAAWGSASPRPGAGAPAPNSAWGSKSPAYQAPSNQGGGNAAWGSVEPTAPTPAADAWGSVSPAYQAPPANSAWASVEAPTPYASAPTPAAPTPYASAPTPAAGAWDDDYPGAPTPAASAPTPAGDGW